MQHGLESTNQIRKTAPGPPLSFPQRLIEEGLCIIKDLIRQEELGHLEKIDPYRWSLRRLEHNLLKPFDLVVQVKNEQDIEASEKGCDMAGAYVVPSGRLAAKLCTDPAFLIKTIGDLTTRVKDPLFGFRRCIGGIAGTGDMENGIARRIRSCRKQMPDADAQGMWVYLIHASIAGSCQRLSSSRIYVGGLDDQKGYTSLMHGGVRQVRPHDTFANEVSDVAGEIKALLADGTDARSICIVARTPKLLDQYEGALKIHGVKIYQVKPSQPDDPNKIGVPLATMPRVKGLEFEHVFIVGVNTEVVPLTVSVGLDEGSHVEHETRERALLYVSATRAKKSMMLTSHGAPSPFL
ncbi:MAG: 3'-5' exonuclease [Rhodothermales bacterium]